MKIKVITVCQPYAELIASGEKFVENRTWGTEYRGPIAIHAGKSKEWLRPLDRVGDFQYGAIIAVGRLVACMPLEGMKKLNRTQRVADLTIGEILYHEHTVGPWCWVIRSIRRLAPVRPCRGAQGLWTWELPDDMADSYAAHLLDRDEAVRERFKTQLLGEWNGR